MNAYWNSTAHEKRDSLLETRIYLGSELNPANAKVLTQIEYDDPNTTGNITRELRWDSQLVSSATGIATTGVTLGAGSAAITTRSYVVGRKGLLDSTTDPNGVVTKYAYGQVHTAPSGSACPVAYMDLYSTAITAAFGRPEAQVRKYYFDCGTGALNHAVFESNNNTRTSYMYDVFGRVTQEGVAAEQADANRKRVMTTEYDDLNRRIRLVQDNKLGWVFHFNNRGELYLRRENSDSATSPITASELSGIRAVILERTVPGIAHYILTSNPHLTSTADTDPTMGWMLQRLDRAGRVEQVSYFRGKSKPAPFGSSAALTGSITYSYSGATTTITDSAGISRSTTVDALGRIQAAADGVSSATYVYDVLDNITSVTQVDSSTYGCVKMQTRSFLYT